MVVVVDTVPVNGMVVMVMVPQTFWVVEVVDEVVDAHR